jgi:hypothetical protein
MGLDYLWNLWAAGAGVVLLFGAFTILSALFKSRNNPDSSRVPFKRVLLGPTPSPYRLRTAGCLIPYVLEPLFRYLNYLSISRWWAAFWIIWGREKTDRRGDIGEARAVDAYVIFALIILVAWVVPSFISGMHTTSNEFAFVPVTYLLVEMFQRTFNIVLFDHVRGHPGVANIQRSVILGLVNIAQLIFGFALIYDTFAGERFISGDSTQTIGLGGIRSW